MKSPRRIVALMIAFVAIVTALAWLDAASEADRAFADFATERTLDGQKLVNYMHPANAEDLRGLGAPGESVALFHDARTDAFVGDTGQPIDAAPLARLREGRARGAPWVRLDRATSPALGLPARASVAVRFAAPASRSSSFDEVWIVSTAARERDRELAAQRRAVGSVVVAVAIVLVFGAWLLREQKKEHALSQRLAIAEATRAYEERLGRADKLATLGALATGIAHELGTPLGVIVGRAEQLESRVKDDEAGARAVQAIFDQAARIRQIIAGFSRLARGGAPAFEDVRVATLFEKARDLTRHRFDAANVALVVEAPPADLRVQGEPLLLEQALVNLLLNACDACSDKQACTVELAARTDDAHVLLDVTDDGDGIAAGKAERAQEPFFTTKESGTGLGLAIVTEIVRHHRGELAISARDGEPGTRATLSLPKM